MSRRRRRWGIAAVAVIGLLAAQIAVAWAVTSRFGDVPTSSPFLEDIEWLADADVTRGCGDGSDYCPTEPVTRQQMAAFMHRLAVNRVVDAGSVRGLGPEDLRGQPGPQGPQGDPGIVDFYSRSSTYEDSASGAHYISVHCREGDLPTGGGVAVHVDSFRLTTNSRFEMDDGFGNVDRGWYGGGVLETGLGSPAKLFTVTVVCADLTP